MRMLLCAVTGATPTDLVAHGERVLTAAQCEQVEALVKRRLAGEPMAYILGEREFFSRMFKVAPGVLIPRPDTELLVELALQRMPRAARVLDLGTGSGVIAITLACERGDARVTGVDNSSIALAIARENAQRQGANVSWIESDWYAGIETQRFELLVANPPYIAAHEPHLHEGDLRFEPRSALTDEADGLQCIDTIIKGARTVLVNRGWLLIEHGHEQAPQVRAMLNAGGFNEIDSWRDLASIERVSGGRGTSLAG